MESPFAVGDTIEVTGATGFNTTSATVTQNIPPNPTGSHGFDASQSGKVVIGVASSANLTSNCYSIFKKSRYWLMSQQVVLLRPTFQKFK